MDDLGKSVYHKGYLKIPDLTFTIEEVTDNGIVHLEDITVTGKETSDEMDKYQSIIHHEPISIARRKAHAKYPDKTLIVLVKE